MKRDGVSLESPAVRLLILFIFLVVAAFLGLSCGPSGMLLSQLWSGWAEFWSDPIMQSVMWDIRLPRVILGACVGAGLAVSGAVLQAFFRNPLADPGLIGISSGAALGAVAYLSLGGAGLLVLGSFGLPLSAFLCGMVATALIYLLARSQGRVVAVTFLLCGIAVNAMLAAIMSYLIFLSDDQALRSITFWLMGSLGFASWKEVLAILPLVLSSLAVFPWLGKSLNLYLLGEVEAEQLGVNVGRVKFLIIALSAACVGAGVAVAGMVGFIGLVVPHITRMVLGADHRWVLPGSALLGAGIVILSDVLARTLVAPVELPLGVITAVIGGPFFMWLIFKEQKKILF